MSVNDCQLPEELHNTTKKHSQTIAINCIIQLLLCPSDQLHCKIILLTRNTEARSFCFLLYTYISCLVVICL